MYNKSKMEIVILAERYATGCTITAREDEAVTVKGQLSSYEFNTLLAGMNLLLQKMFEKRSERAKDNKNSLMDQDNLFVQWTDLQNLKEGLTDED